MLADLFGDRILVGVSIGDGANQRLAQPFHLALGLRFVDVMARDVNAFGFDDERQADGNAGRNGNASFDFHERSKASEELPIDN